MKRQLSLGDGVSINNGRTSARIALAQPLMNGHHYGAHFRSHPVASWFLTTLEKEIRCKGKRESRNFLVMLFSSSIQSSWFGQSTRKFTYFKWRWVLAAVRIQSSETSCKRQSKWKFVQMFRICLDARSFTSSKMNFLTAFRFIFLPSESATETIHWWKNRSRNIDDNQTSPKRDRKSASWSQKIHFRQQFSGESFRLNRETSLKDTRKQLKGMTLNYTPGEHFKQINAAR